MRRNVVVQLIRMVRDAGHPDYEKVNMTSVAERAQRLAATAAPIAPSSLLEFFFEGTDQGEGSS